MADNVALATGSGGATIAADEVVIGTATVSVQRIKIAYGSTDAYNEVATGLPLPVMVEGSRIAVDSVAGGSDNGFVFLAVRDDALAEITATDGDYAQLRTSSEGALWVKTSTDVTLATGNTLDVAVATTATQPVEVQNTATVSLTATGLDPLSNLIATGASTNDTLAAGGTWTSTGVDVSEYSTVSVTLTTTRPSTASEMRFEFSQDETTWSDIYRFTYSTTTATADSRRFQFPVTAQYFRINYTNTTTSTQEVFDVQTILHKRDIGTSVHRLSDNVSADRSTELTKAAIMAQISGAGDFIPIQSNAAGNLKIGGSVGVEEWTASEAVTLATTATMPVSLATTATYAVVLDGTATVNANLRIGGADATATTPIPIYLLDTATGGTATVAVSLANTATVNIANTATVAITGLVSLATTATQPVTVTSFSATEQINVIGSTTATLPVSVGTHTATGPYYIDNAGTATIAVTVATDKVFDVSAATTATQPVLIQNGATNALIIQPFNIRAQGTQIFTSVSATTLATLATGVANTYRDLVWMTMNNNATTEAQIRIRDTSTATWNNLNLAPDGGGISFTPVRPAEQSEVATGWDVQLESAIDGRVYIAAQFVDVT